MEYAIVPACRFDHLATFPDVVGVRLFDVDVLAGLTGKYARRSVPVIGSRNQHGVDVFGRKQLVHVLTRAGLSSLQFFHQCGGVCQPPFVQVADTDNFDTLFDKPARHDLSPSAAADPARVHSLVGAENM